MAPRTGFTFFGMVGGVMAALKLKEHWDQYKPLSGDEDEGRVQLTAASPLGAAPPAYRDDAESDPEAGVALLNTELPSRRARKQKRNCCVCCGINCGLFFKALGIVTGLFFVYGVVKLLFWAFTPSPTGLEGMPAFGVSLGCADAPYIYNGSQVQISVPGGGVNGQDHGFDSNGGAFGTFTIAEGAESATEVVYQITLRTNDESLLEKVIFHYSKAEEDGSIPNSKFVLATPSINLGTKSCMRYDITMLVPPTLKKLHVASHSLTQVKVDKNANIQLDDLYITLFNLDSKNMILPAQQLLANKLTLEMYNGWMVGDASIIKETSIMTQRGDAIANIHAYPVAPSNPENPEVASFMTVTGGGRTDVFYIANGVKRPMDNIHTSSKNGDVYLNYKESTFSGKIGLDSRSYTMTGPTHSIRSTPTPEGSDKWTHFVGDQNGEDKMLVSSRGWTGLYF